MHILLSTSIFLRKDCSAGKYLIHCFLQKDVGVLGYFSEHIGPNLFELVDAKLVAIADGLC